MELLYFPTIAIPDGSWLRRALLYSDGVRSIAPEGYIDDQYSREVDLLRFLRDQGEYSPLTPSFETARLEDAHDFHREFASSIAPFLRGIGSRGTNLMPVTIHEQKFSTSVIDFCEDLGVARRTDDGWLTFDQDVGYLYLSLLAKYVSLRSDDELVASTSNPKLAKHVLSSNSKASGEFCLTYRLRSALPEPSARVPLADLISFKRRRRDELLRLRQETRKLERDLARASDKREIKDIAASFDERVTTALRDLESALADARIESRASSVKGFVSLRPDSPLAAGMGAAITSQFVGLSGSSTAVAVAAVASVVVGCESVSSWTKRRAIRRGAAFGYLYEAERAGLLHPRNGRLRRR